MKKLSLVVLVFLVTLSLMGCNNTNKTTQQYRQIEPIQKASEYIFSNSSFTAENEAQILKDAALVIRCEALGKSEYEFGDKYYRGVEEVKVTEVYFSDNKKIVVGSKINILNPSTSHDWYEGAVSLEAGKGYVLIVNNIVYEEGKSTFDYRPIAQYTLMNPIFRIMSLDGDSVEIDPIFSSFNNIAQKATRRTLEDQQAACLVIDKDAFVSKLKNLLTQYKD